MIYCLINNGDFYNNNFQLNYSIIDSLCELRINKKFNIDLNSNVTYMKFSKFQKRTRCISDCIDEISNDFNRSKFVVGNIDFIKFYDLEPSFENLYLNIKDKSFNLNQMVEKINGLKHML